MSKILKINQTTGERTAGVVAFDEIEAGVLSGVLVQLFDFSDLASAFVVGVVPIGKSVYRVAVDVVSAFDNNAIVTVGDDIGEARLMLSDELDLTVADRFTSEPDYVTEADTTFKIYPVSGTPTVGSGIIKIYYQ